MGREEPSPCEQLRRGVDAATPGRSPRAAASSHPLGAGEMMMIDGGPLRSVHAPRSETGGGHAVLLQLEGGCVIEQPAGACELTPGSMVILDDSKPTVRTANGSSDAQRWLFARVPSRTFGGGMFERAPLRVMTKDNAVDRLLHDLLLNLWSSAPHIDGAQQEAGLAALDASARMSSAAQDARRTARVHVRVERAIALIERELADPDLTAERVASAQGVSRRYLDGLFAASGSSVEAWIRERRLQRAAEALKLGSPDTKLLAVAVESGFSSQSHFSRAFARRFGMTPSQWRKRTSLAVAAAKLGDDEPWR
ncbi:helix-turn-helix domain-containing protein [Sorangium sp. So ce394]|uniref:helix-turn-helix domain-containing protein n=1 Tax=Sorangium sp. So ce394 TaxID=3133310 RepID=UPI003F5BAF5D